MDEHPGDTKHILFNDLIPLPFRVLFLIQLGLTLWFLLCAILFHFTNINVLQLLNLSYNSHNYTQLDSNNNVNSMNGEFATTVAPDFSENKRLIKGIWNTIKYISIVNFLTWIIFRITKETYPELSTIHSIITSLAFGFTFYKIFYKSKNTVGQIRVFTTIKRILRGNINSRTMRSNDILISDSLVSYSKVLNDFGLYIWSYYYNIEKSYNHQIEFSMLCLPTLIRIKQCWYEYRLTSQKQHLYNLFKYSTAFGPLITNLIIKKTLLSSTESQRESGELISSLKLLNNWWYFTSFINSTYSFIWDIKMDWGLNLFNLTKPSSSRILRQKITYHKLIYAFAVSIDFLLRYIWVLKFFIINEDLKAEKVSFIHVFSTFLFGYDVYSFGYAFIEFLEIIRRWIWCFIKLENDWIKLQKSESSIELNQFPKQG